MPVYTRSRTRRGSTVGSIVRAVGTVFAVILGLHIVFVLFEANAGNSFVDLIAQWAGVLAIFFRDLFATGNIKLDVFLNYGLAAVFWLVVTGLLARLLSRAA